MDNVENKTENKKTIFNISVGVKVTGVVYLSEGQNVNE